MQDFILSKEVRLGTYSANGNPQAHAVVGALLETSDKRAYLYGDRVPHVIARRGPGGKLAENAYHVKDFLWTEDEWRRAGNGGGGIIDQDVGTGAGAGAAKRKLYMDEKYYIEQMIIPALKRVFDHVGVDVRAWYRDMPKILRADEHLLDHEPFDDVLGAAGGGQVGLAKYGIDSHFRKAGCVNCGGSVEDRDGASGPGEWNFYHQPSCLIITDIVSTIRGVDL